ncbi:MAG: dihydropteroate synthase [Planctomycetota bacterium]|nr:dihydropteroate synthase [Planctomycetota bacterium]
MHRGSSLFQPTPQILGVLNVTPDSFSDGGKFLAAEAAAAQAKKMVAEGARALDLGAESTRPGSKGVSAKDQKQRLLPVLKALRKDKAFAKVPLSIDTQSAEVARACLGEGADLINDISALRHDRQMAKVIARAKCPVILMHMQGTPRTMQKDPTYDDVIEALDRFFRRRIHAAHDAGIAPSKILLDPGIGFGKTLAHNLTILNRLAEFKALGRPLVVGVSRKRFLGTLTGEEIPERRVTASVAAGMLAVAHGAALLRVHDVAEHVQALKVAHAILHPEPFQEPQKP